MTSWIFETFGKKSLLIGFFKVHFFGDKICSKTKATKFVGCSSNNVGPLYFDYKNSLKRTLLFFYFFLDSKALESKALNTIYIYACKMVSGVSYQKSINKIGFNKVFFQKTILVLTLSIINDVLIYGLWKKRCLWDFWITHFFSKKSSYKRKTHL